MNENIDLTKILKGCPIGTEFYSSIFGKVLFMGIDRGTPTHPILVKVNIGISKCEQFAKNGRYYPIVGECTLFPSKDQRDWLKFERFWDKQKVEKFDVNTLHPFDKILARDNPDELWDIELFSHKTGNIVKGFYSAWCCAIPFNENTKHLIGTREDCPDYYKWWEK